MEMLLSPVSRRCLFIFFLFLNIRSLVSTPVSSHANSLGSTRSLLHSDQETPLRPSCQEDKECSPGFFCLKRVKDHPHCVACFRCNEHRRKPGWTQCARSFAECGGCIDGYSGITCVIKVNEYMRDKTPTESTDSASVPNVTIGILLAMLVVFIVVGLVVPAFARKYNGLPSFRQTLGRSEEWHELGQRTKIVELDESPFTTDGELTPLSRSRSASGQVQEPSAPYLLPPPPFNPSYGLAQSPCQIYVANEEPVLISSECGPQSSGHVQDTQKSRRNDNHQRALPYERGAGAGEAAEILLGPQQQAVATEQAIVDPDNAAQTVEQNDENFGTVPHSFGIENENSYDLEGLIAENMDNGGQASEVPGYGPPNNQREIPNEPLLLSPNQLSTEESQIFQVSDSIIDVQGEIRLSIFSPFTTHSHIQMTQQGYHDNGWDIDHDPVIQHARIHHQQLPATVPVQNDNHSDVDSHVVPQGKNCD